MQQKFRSQVLSQGVSRKPSDVVVCTTMSGTSSIGKPLPSALLRVAQEWAGKVATVNAPAKVNLRLKVEGRRSDGYHLLSMINCSTSLQDELSITLMHEGEIELTVEPATWIPDSGGENLVVRAVKSFWREFGYEAPPLGFRCHLVKRIPIGGGLGGGSADAGAVLRHMWTLFGAAFQESLDISSEEAHRRVMAAALSCGADVPYAVVGGLCWVGGIGGHVVPLAGRSVAPTKVLLMVPPKGVPTASFYERFRSRYPVLEESQDSIGRAFATASSSDLLPLVENDFESTACEMVPEIGEGLRCAREVFPQGTALTGSGSVFFSLVPEDGLDKAGVLRERLKAHGIASYLCELIFS
jgi:4-diphosphocytidyl-2-C-methyl-D-erythritol kinase